MKLMPWLLITALLLGCSDGGGDDDDDDNDTNADATVGGIDAGLLDGPAVVMETSMGTMVVKLAQSEMPITTANFLSYVDSGFYDGTLVHRVLDGWVIQGGGYTSGLTPKAPNAPIVLETSTRLSHTHGAISMARTSDPDSATSQWFIVDWPDQGTPPQPGQLDGQYAAFGVVIEGLDVLAAISEVPTASSGGLDDVPVTEVVLTSARRQ